MKTDIKLVLIIIFTSSLLGLIYNFFSPSGIALIAEKKEMQWADDSLFNSNLNEDFQKKDTTTITLNDKSKVNSDSSINKKDEINKPVTKKELSNSKDDKEETELSEPVAIHIKQAYNLYQQNAFFIDAREPEDFKYAHIKNSINIPFDHFDNYKHLLDNINKEKIIVTYCAGTDCDLSKLLGNLLFEMGYKKVFIFFGGWNEWLEADYPIEK